MTTLSEQIKAEIEDAARVLNLEPSTIGRQVGQGGLFYRRLENGARVWPETAADVRRRLGEMLVLAGHTPSPVNTPPADQGRDAAALAKRAGGEA